MPFPVVYSSVKCMIIIVVVNIVLPDTGRGARGLVTEVVGYIRGCGTLIHRSEIQVPPLADS